MPRRDARGNSCTTNCDKRPREGRRKPGLTAGAWPEEYDDDAEWPETAEPDTDMDAGLSVRFEDEEEAPLALEGDASWENDIETEAGLVLKEMGLLDVDHELAEAAGYASTESEDLWDAYSEGSPGALAGYNGDRPTPAFSDARSAHGRGTGSGKGREPDTGKGLKGGKVKAKGSKCKPAGKGSKAGDRSGQVTKPGSGKSKREDPR